MNTEGQIRQFNTIEEARAAGFLIPLKAEQAEQLRRLAPPDRLRELERSLEQRRSKNKAARKARRKQRA